MLIHKGKTSSGERVLVLGSQGFIGRALISALKNTLFEVEGLSSQDLDLTNPQSIFLLSDKLKSCDHLVMLSCLTPDKGKGHDTLVKNILMGKHVCDALAQQEKRPHVVYLSSDSVYNFDEALVREETPPSPIDVYGAMHRTRELMFLETVPETLAIIRSTLVYGPGDSHNSYGPNRLRREAFKEGAMTLFGQGEDTRAHIFIDDLVNLISLVLENYSVGTINGAPDSSITYGDLAVLISECFQNSFEIKNKPRAAAPAHRYFEASHCYEAFPGFTFTSLREGLMTTYQKMLEDPNV